MTYNKRVKRNAELVADLERQGATARPLKYDQGWLIRFPNGDTTTIHHTPSDRRSEKNTRARVLRAGLTWPLPEN